MDMVNAIHVAVVDHCSFVMNTPIVGGFMSDDAVNVAIVMDMVNAIHVAVVDDTTLVVDLG